MKFAKLRTLNFVLCMQFSFIVNYMHPCVVTVVIFEYI